MKMALVGLLLLFSVTGFSQEDLSFIKKSRSSVFFDPDAKLNFLADVITLKNGTVIAFVNKPRLFDPDGNHLSQYGGEIVKDRELQYLQNNPQVNCHGFAMQSAHVPHLPKDSWVEGSLPHPNESRLLRPSSVQILLNTYFKPILGGDQNTLAQLAYNPSIRAGDVVTFVLTPYIYSEHSSVVIEKTINGKKVFWLRSKLGENLLVDHPPEAARYYKQWNAFGVFRRL